MLGPARTPLRSSTSSVRSSIGHLALVEPPPLEMLQADEDADAWRLAQLDDSSGWISCVKVKMTPSRIESGVGCTSARPYCAIMSSSRRRTI